MASPPPPLPASPASEESGEGEGLQEEGGSLGEMMRCLVLLQRWGMFTPEDTWAVLQRQACVRGCGLVLCRSRMCWTSSSMVKSPEPTEHFMLWNMGFSWFSRSSRLHLTLSWRSATAHSSGLHFPESSRDGTFR